MTCPSAPSAARVPRRRIDPFATKEYMQQLVDAHQRQLAQNKLQSEQLASETQMQLEAALQKVADADTRLGDQRRLLEESRRTTAAAVAAKEAAQAAEAR